MPTRVQLTDSKIAALRPPKNGRVEYPDTLAKGLRIRVSSTGVKVFALRTLMNKKPRNVTLGKYPTLKLAEARERARSMLSDIGDGRDPVTTHLELQRGKGAGTISAIVEQYLAAEVRGLNPAGRPKKKSAKSIERIFKMDILPEIGNHRADRVDHVDVTNMVDAIHAASSPRPMPRKARMAHQLLSGFYAWAMKRNREILRNPCRGADVPAVGAPRERVLSDRELKALWNAAVVEGTRYGAGVQLLILTAQRRTEVFAARWSEFDLDNAIWVIPGERTKNGRANRVPLSKPALAVLKALPRAKADGRLFPSSADPERTFTGFTKGWNRLFNAMAAEAGTNERATMHDIRRTVATGLERLGIPLPVSEAILNHVSGSKAGIAAVYHRHDFAAEKKAALDLWGKEVLRIAATK